MNAFAASMRRPRGVLASDALPSLNTAGPLVDLLERLEGMPAGASTTMRAVLSAPDRSRLSEALEAAAWHSANEEARADLIDAPFGASVATAAMAAFPAPVVGSRRQ